MATSDLARRAERQEWFLERLELCKVVFDFTRENVEDAEMSARNAKFATLSSLVVAVRTDYAVIDERVIKGIFEVVAANAFRDRLTPRPPGAPAFDPEEDDPHLMPDWEHLQKCYELLLSFFETPIASSKLAMPHLNDRFINDILRLFYYEDPRERNLAKLVVHRLYASVVGVRRRIRSAIEHIFNWATYDDTGACIGIADILDVLAGIIHGYSVPLKEEHCAFFKNALLPLYSASAFAQYAEELKYCVLKFLAKDDNLASVIIKRLLRYWSKVNSTKQVLFLYHLEEVLTLITPEQFNLCKLGVFRKVAECIKCRHFQVAERALHLFADGRFYTIVASEAAEAYPILVPALNKCIQQKLHWNSLITDIANHFCDKLKEANTEQYHRAISTQKRKREHNNETHEREAKWQKLEALALRNKPDIASSALTAPAIMSSRMDSADDDVFFYPTEDEDDDVSHLEHSRFTKKKPLLIRRKSLLPHDSDIQEKIASFAKDKSLDRYSASEHNPMDSSE
eukprot:m.61056 g.61056  ORF g.61056 m.61056 type:complete len:513 (-) comp11373_c0_seq1:472-2010(-)